MGGKESWGFLAPTGSGENELMRCENGDYYADIEAARGVARAADFPVALDAPEEVETPGVTTIEGLAEFLGIDAAATSKAMPVVTGDRLVLALVRGDDRLSEEKLMTFFEAAFRPATEDEIRATFGAGGGSLGPLEIDVEVIADETLRDGQFVAGANRDGWHLRGVEAGRDYQPTFADIRQAREGDACPVCGGRLSVQPAIEVGHIFKLGTFHSEPLGATFLDEDGRERPIVMGSYGIGPARTIAAAVEQRHDERGIVWPAVDRAVRRPRARAVGRRRGGRGARRGPRRGALGGGTRRAAGRSGRAAGREVRRRGPARLPAPRHGGTQEPGRRRGRRPPSDGRGRRARSARVCD